MADTQFDIDYIARLARIRLSDSEKKVYAAQLTDILEYVEKLKELNTENIPSSTHPTPATNVMRSDVVKASLSTESALENAPEQIDRLFRTPKIIE